MAPDAFGVYVDVTHRVSHALVAEQLARTIDLVDRGERAPAQELRHDYRATAGAQFGKALDECSSIHPLHGA
jgi:hypothetical protein